MRAAVAEEIRQLQALDSDIERGITQAASAPLARIPIESLPSAVGYERRIDDGQKFAGGFGPTQLLTADYWTLRARSAQLFETNLYARGIIRRLVTNEINTGLHLEATPEEGILGYPEDGLAEWAEDVENRFKLWCKSARLCDHGQELSFGRLQQAARMEALIAGDVLVVLRQDPRTGLPRLQLFSGSAVQSPRRAPRRGNRVSHGVELDQQGRQVGYWIRQSDGRFARLPAYGEKSGRRTAWLLYGSDKRLDAVRGKPMLSLVLQSLREIDRYRDSTQRKAVINSMLAMFITKGEDKPGTRPLAGGAVRLGTSVATESGAEERTYNTADFIPGLVLDELQHGETPHAFPSAGTDERLGTFEEAIIAAVAWSNEIPPEILRLAFSKNYSASAAAINEFKIYLNRIRSTFGEEFCQRVYDEWLPAQVATGRVVAPGLFESRRDIARYDEFSAWISADWSGAIKPSTDIYKQARGYKLLVDEGFITRDRASRELTGTKYSKNAKKLRRENEALASALEVLGGAEHPRPGALDSTGFQADEGEEE